LGQRSTVMQKGVCNAVERVCLLSICSMTKLGFQMLGYNLAVTGQR